MTLRYLFPIVGMKFIWEDDQQWRDVKDWEYIVVILYNSVFLTGFAFLMLFYIGVI